MPRRPFRRYRRRRPYRRSGGSRWGSWFRKGVNSIASAAYNSGSTAVWNEIYKIKGLVNSEMYKYDQSQTGLSLTNSGGVLHVTSVAQGDGDSARTGNSILARSVNIKGVLKYNSVGTVFAQPCRLIVVIDTQQVGDASPTVATVLEQATTYSHINSDTAGRFKVLYNRVYNLNSGTAAAIPFQINIPMRHHVRYNGTLSTDIQKGGIYFLYMSNESSTYPTMDYECRLSYHDN